MLLSSDKPAKADKPAPARPARPDRDTLLAMKAEVRKCEARVEKIEAMRETLAKKLADTALYEPGRKGELETWNKKYAEVMDGLRRAEALWEAAAGSVENAGKA